MGIGAKEARDLAAAVLGGTRPETGPTKVQATVRGIDADGTVWVQLAGAPEVTPVRETTAAVAVGDVVTATVGGGKVAIDGNRSRPATDDAKADEALVRVVTATESAAQALAAATAAKAEADSAHASAESASADAARAYGAAETATADAATAQASAQSAIEDAAAAQASADAAQASADAAVSDASDAKTAAQGAQASATAAQTAASAAQTSASAAQTQASAASASAAQANSAATDALAQLSTVQDVVGVLDWASSHGTYSLTADTAVQPGKQYFTRTGGGTEADPYVYTPVASPTDEGLPGYYELTVDEAMQQYLLSHLALTDEGLWITEDSSGYRLLLKSDGAYVVDPDGASVSLFGVTSRIGKTGESHVEMDYHSLQLVDKDNKTYFHVSDMRDKNGKVWVTEKIRYIAGTNTYTLKYSPSSDFTLNWCDNYYGTSQRNPGSYTRNDKTVTLEQALPETAICLVAKYRADISVNAFTLGERASSSSVGPFSTALGKYNEAAGTSSFAHGTGCHAIGNDSHAEGNNTTAVGSSSHTEGYNTQAIAMGSHAEGQTTTASGWYSHSEGNGSAASGQAAHSEGHSTASGDWSHAEGHSTESRGAYSHAEGFMSTGSGGESHAEGYNTLASADCSHAEGYGSKASGLYSHAQNYSTIASGSSQTALGKWNESDTSKALIIGNGTSENARSNALTVDWSGNVETAGDITAAGDLYSGTMRVALEGHTHTPASIGAAAASHTHDYLPLAGGEVTGTLKLTKDTDASGTADKQPALMIGDDDGTHLEIDGNEIMAKASGTTTANLNLNADGGLVVVGSGGMRTTGRYYARKADYTLGTAPSSDTYYATTEFQDSAGTVVGHDEYRLMANGSIRHHFAAVRQMVNGEPIWHQATMTIDTSGVATWVIPSPANFRSAIGAAESNHTHDYLPLGGGTMTGPIAMKNSTAMPRATGTGWYPVVMDSFGDGGGLRYMNPDDVPALIGAAADDHSHAASDVTSGSFGVARGGTGRSTLTSGSYLVGNGTSAVALKTPAQVLSDIGAAPDTLTTSTAASQITVASGFSVNTCSIAVFAGVIVTARIGIHTDNALTANTNYTVGTLKAGLRPHANIYLNPARSEDAGAWWITTGGAIVFRPGSNRNANTNNFASGTWIATS